MGPNWRANAKCVSVCVHSWGGGGDYDSLGRKVGGGEGRKGRLPCGASSCQAHTDTHGGGVGWG